LALVPEELDHDEGVVSRSDRLYSSEIPGRPRNSRGLAPSAGATIPSRSICSTILAERLYPILSRR
jgi:hypothetical protein